MSVSAPVLAVVFGSVTPPQGDVVDCQIHLGCSKEVSSFSIKLQNWSGQYSTSGAMPITVGMDGSLYMGRGENCPQLITCRVESTNYESSPTESYLTVSGRCWGERLFRRVVSKTYSSQKGESIVKDLLDYYAGIGHVRNASELVENTDTTYSQLEYTDSPLWDILKYIAETADKAGVIGFDFRVAPDGKFEFFSKNSKTNPTNLSESIENGRYRKDISRVRNKITIYGVADKSLPIDKVSWTRSLTPMEGTWTSGSGIINLDLTGAPDSEACIQLNVPGALYYGSCLFTLDSGEEVNCELYPSINFQSKLDSTYSGTGKLQLFDQNGKATSKNISVSPDAQWHTTEVGVGSAYANQWESIQSGFDWTHIWRVSLTYWFSENAGAGNFCIHQLYFGGRRYSAIAQDASSQAAYALREFVETDEELWSDNECNLRAQALLTYLKSPAEYLTITSTVIDYGMTPILAGDKIHVTLPNENVDTDFRVESIEYHFAAEEQTIELSIELGKEPPKLADYLYGLRTFTVNVEKLSRTKLGKRGIPAFTSGGGGSANSCFGSNVEIDKSTPILNLLTGRALKSALGFDGINTFLVTYTGDLILRAQSQLLRPYADDNDDLGSPSFGWRNIYIKRLCNIGSLNIAGLPVITDTRTLQNVTATADIITSGVIAEARLPNVYSGALYFNGGLTAANYKSSYGNPGLTTPITYLKDLAGNTGVLTFQNGLLTGAT